MSPEGDAGVSETAIGLQWPEWFALVGILILAIALRAPLMDRGLEYDEVWSALEFIETPTVLDTVSTYRQFNNHILYSLSARASEAVLGRSEVALRMPALAFGMLAIPVLWLAARARFGRLVGLTAAFALATSSIHIGFSVSARGYTGLVLFTLVSSVLFMRWLRRGLSTPGIVTYVAASVLALYVHLFAGAVLTAQALLVSALALVDRFGRPRGRHLPAGTWSRVVLGMAATGVLTVLVYSPVLPALLENLTTGRHSAFRPRLPAQVLLYMTGWGNQLPGHALVALAVGGWLAVWRRHRDEAVFAGLVTALPIAVVLIARPEFVRERFFVFLLPVLALGYALGFAALGRVVLARVSRTMALPLVAAAVVLLVWALAARPWSNVPIGGFREAVAALEAPSDGRTVGICAIGTGVDLYRWYASEPLFIPSTVAAFDAWSAGFDEVRCAYRAQGPPAHREIAARLAQADPAPDRYFVIQVFRMTPREPGTIDVPR